MNTKTKAKLSKFNLRKILIILVIAIAVIIGIIVSFSIAGRPYDETNNSYKTVKIREGYDVEDIASVLHKKGIIGNEDKFVSLSHMLIHGVSFKPGVYYLSPSMNYRSITNTITKGITMGEGFELPAGYTVKQTAASLDQAGFVKKDEFLEIASTLDLSEFSFIDENIDGYEKIEGYLLPGRYDGDPDANSAMILITMLNEFDNYYNDEFRARADEMGLSTKDVVIIASMIEKATSIEKEKSDISSVIHNKLNLGSKFDGGFPAAPLCSPSRESIKAALYPTDTENLYYVPDARLNGTHIFTSDRREYLALLDAYNQAVENKKERENKDSDK